MHSTLFGEGDHHIIPPPNSLDLSKLVMRGVITTDTCNKARKISRLLCAEVKEAVQTKLQANLAEGEVVDESLIMVLRADCHHHLRNI